MLSSPKAAGGCRLRRNLRGPMRFAFLAALSVSFSTAAATAETGLTSGAAPWRAAIERADYRAARTLAEGPAAQGDAPANVALGLMYEKGLGVRPDIGAALVHYSAAAVKGSADAQLALGRIAVEGAGVYPDFERAAGWFRLAAAGGDPRADVRLGLMLADGIGVRKDLIAAASHFAKAAAKGDRDGLFYLGFAFMNGDGVPQNYAGAAKYFADAADKGQAEAAYHLALLHDSPVLGGADARAASRYMAMAAAGGHAPAFAAMGLIVHRGDAAGVAADGFENGARAGDPQSSLLYAVALSKGDGRPKDVAAAVDVASRLALTASAPAPIRAQAERLVRTLTAQIAGPLTLRD